MLDVDSLQSGQNVMNEQGLTQGNDEFGHLSASRKVKSRLVNKVWARTFGQQNGQICFRRSESPVVKKLSNRHSDRVARDASFGFDELIGLFAIKIGKDRFPFSAWDNPESFIFVTCATAPSDELLNKLRFHAFGRVGLSGWFNYGFTLINREPWQDF